MGSDSGLAGNGAYHGRLFRHFACNFINYLDPNKMYGLGEHFDPD